MPLDDVSVLSYLMLAECVLELSPILCSLWSILNLGIFLLNFPLLKLKISEVVPPLKLHNCLRNICSGIWHALIEHLRECKCLLLYWCPIKLGKFLVHQYLGFCTSIPEFSPQIFFFLLFCLILEILFSKVLIFWFLIFFNLWLGHGIWLQEILLKFIDLARFQCVVLIWSRHRGLLVFNWQHISLLDCHLTKISSFCLRYICLVSMACL